jgi:DNA gyrase subunit A
MKKYNLSEVQAKSILAMRLSSLAKLEKLELENEKKELIEKIAEIKNILQFENLQIDVIMERLDGLVKKYGDKRRTELAQIQLPTKEEKEQIAIEPQKCVVVMTEDGYIKRIPTSSFKVQKRNGKGVKTQNDINAAIIRTNTVDSMMIFSNTGKMYRITVNDIPEGTNAQKGQPIKSLIQMESAEKPVLMYSIYKDSPAKFVLFATQNGMVKKTSLEEYSKTKKKTGLAAIDIKEGDALASVTLIDDEDVIVLTEKGMGIKFDSTEISMTSRATKGMKGINLNEGDKVVGIFPIRDENDKIAIYSEKGLGKKMDLSELPKQKRGGKGLVCYKTSDASGDIVGATLVNDSDLVLLVGSKNSICISAKDIPTLGRSSIGNQLLKGTVSSVSKV